MTFTEAFTAYPWFLLGCALLLGALVGSFLNVVIHRLPIMLERQWRAGHETLRRRGPISSRATASADTQATPNVGPERYNLVTPRSRCPKCSAPIKPHQNIPVLSWLLLGGKCANCSAPISVRYPVVELATALLSVAVAGASAGTGKRPRRCSSRGR